MRSPFARAAVLAVCVSCVAPRLSAQTACGDIAKLFAKPPVIGQWAELKMERPGSSHGPATMRMAVVGKEKRGGKTLYRMQMASTDPRSGQPVIVQMLSPWGADALSGAGQGEMVMKFGSQPAMKMTRGKGAAGQGPSDFREQCAKYKFVGEEAVTVPAGTFTARRYSGPDGDSWVSPDVPAWHLVRTEGKDSTRMTLTAVGDGAKNEIRETPVDFKTMMNDPEAMKRFQKGRSSEQPAK